jgi:hypothetical protein
MHALPVHLYADAAAAVSLFVLIFLESRSKRSLLMPMDPVRIVVILFLTF